MKLNIEINNFDVSKIEVFTIEKYLSKRNTILKMIYLLTN